MRILLVTPFLPHARAAHGGGVYLHALTGALARSAEVALVSLATPRALAADPILPDGLRRSWIVSRSVREGQSGPRLLRHQLRMLGSWTLRGLPVTIAKFRSTVMERTIVQAIDAFRPDAVLLEMDLLAQYLPAIRGVPTVLTDHEAGHPVPAAVGPGNLGRARDLRLWDRYVRKFYPQATCLQALNAEDATSLHSRLHRPVRVRPPLVALPGRAVRPDRAPARILFLGDYRHLPNPQAAEFVARQILPIIRRELPTAELWLAGPNADAGIHALDALPGVRVVGFVADLAELLGSARALVAPVFSGGGSRIKVLTALAHGLPVVANTLALRGIAAPTAAARCEETADDLARATLDWLREPTAAAAAGDAARRWAEHQIAPDAVAHAQVETIAAMLSK